jgi:hypothetical protein
MIRSIAGRMVRMILPFSYPKRLSLPHPIQFKKEKPFVSGTSVAGQRGFFYITMRGYLGDFKISKHG